MSDLATTLYTARVERLDELSQSERNPDELSEGFCSNTVC